MSNMIDIIFKYIRVWISIYDVQKLRGITLFENADRLARTNRNKKILYKAIGTYILKKTC